MTKKAFDPIATTYCMECGKMFVNDTTCYGVYKPHAINKKYCSAECRSKNYRKFQKSKGLPTGTTGAMHELVASIELMRAGFHVFRALSPHCLCDLIALKDKMILRIEVKTGLRNKNGKINASTSGIDHARYDLLAIVFHDGNILWSKSHEQRFDRPPRSLIETLHLLR